LQIPSVKDANPEPSLTKMVKSLLATKKLEVHSPSMWDCVAGCWMFWNAIAFFSLDEGYKSRKALHPKKSSP